MTEPIPHRSFSVLRVAAIARNTFTELVRLKVFYFLLIFALLIIGNSAFMVKFTFQEEFQVLKDVSLGAMSIFTSLLAIAATAMMLPKDIEDRTLYTILAKPVRRFEYLLGKLGGSMLLLGISTVLMGLLFYAVMAFRVHVVAGAVTAEMAQATPEVLADALRQLHEAAWGGSLLQGIVVIYAKACVVAAMTLLISTFASSAIFTMLVAAAVYFIGHLQPIAREYWLEGRTAEGITKLFVIFVSLVFPDLQTFNLVDDIVAGNVVPTDVFLQTMGIGVLYVAIYSLIAGLIFWKKEL